MRIVHNQCLRTTVATGRMTVIAKKDMQQNRWFAVLRLQSEILSGVHCSQHFFSGQWIQQAGRRHEEGHVESLVVSVRCVFDLCKFY